MMKKSLLGLTIGGLLALTGPAQAVSITGDTVNLTHYFPDSLSVNLNLGNQVVPTSSFNYFGIYDVTVNSTFLTLDVHCGTGCFWTDSVFNGPVLTDLSSAVFADVSIDGSSSYAGFDESRLTFDSSHVYINLEGLDANGFLRVNFGANSVPEPSVLALFGIGLLGIGAIRRKTPKTKA